MKSFTTLKQSFYIQWFWCSRNFYFGFLTVYDKTIYYKLCFHTEDVTAAKLACQNNESAVMLEIQTNPVGRKPFLM